MNLNRLALAMLLALPVLAACSGSEPATSEPATSESATTAVATAASGQPADGLCRLLTLDEVAATFPGAEAGKVTEVPMEGVTACTWGIPAGRFVLESWPAAAPLSDEIHDLASGSLDPFKQTDGLVRYETVAGVGDEALAVIEQQDETHGILSDMAILVAWRGDKILVILSDDLPRRDRKQALAALQALGSRAASRLE